MKGIELKRTRYALVAALLCLAMLVGIGVAHTVNVAGATTGPSVTYDTAKDALTVKNGTAWYKFYTTTAATKTVPAANKWMKTDSAAVDMSGVSAGGTLYFADSSAPALNDILAVKVPASPVLVSAVYKPSATTFDEMFTFKAKVPVTITTETTNKKTGKVTTKVSKKTEAVDIPHARIQIKLNDNAAWQDFGSAVTVASLEKMQRDSAVIYARIKPASKLGIAADGNNVYQITDAGTTDKVSIADVETTKESSLSTVVTTKVYDTSALVRYGVSRTIKIARKAAGPAVAIDYANHAMTIKKGQEYGTATSVATDPTGWEAVDKTQKIYFGIKGNVTAASYYAVRTSATAKTPDSLMTYLEIPTDMTFTTTSSVNVSGGFGQNATVKIVNKDGIKGVAYQYAVVDLADDRYAGLIGSKQFDYTNTNVRWTTVKTGTDGTVSVTLSWSTVKGKQVLVRKAAAGNTFSSKVEILNAPGSTDAVAANGTKTIPIAVACWTKLTQDLYNTGFLDSNKNIVFCPNVSITYTGNSLFDIYVYGGKAVADPGDFTAKIGTKSYTVDDSSATKAVDQTNNYKITGVKVTDLPDSNANKVVFTFPDGYATASYSSVTPTGTTSTVASTQKVITVVTDTKKPVIKSAVIKDDTVQLTFDSQIRISGTAIDTLNQTISNSSNVKTNIATTTLKLGTQITCTAYNKKTGVTTISIPYTVVKADTANAKMTVTLTNITDMAGNSFDPATIECDNPAYSN